MFFFLKKFIFNFGISFEKLSYDNIQFTHHLYLLIIKFIYLWISPWQWDQCEKRKLHKNSVNNLETVMLKMCIYYWWFRTIILHIRRKYKRKWQTYIIHPLYCIFYFNFILKVIIIWNSNLRSLKHFYQS